MWRKVGGSTGTSRRADFVEVVEADEHVARLGAVGGPENAGQLELIDDARGAPVADAHAPLQQRRRAELVLDAHFRRLPEEGVPLARRPLGPRPPSLVPRPLR